MSVLSGVLATLRRSKPRPNGKGAEPSAPPHEVPRAAPAPTPQSTPDLEQMAAVARYHRDRLALYRARMHGAAEGTSLSRLRELERAAAAADARLRHAVPHPHEPERPVAADAGLRHARGK
jgi:hypothetical protein